MAKRVILYVDGYNLYHSIARLGKPHLKWLDLRALGERIILQKSEELVEVHLFTAFAKHLKDSSKIIRHQAYLDALSLQGVRYTLGFFSPKNFKCKRPECGNEWTGHEEKETDTNIATHIVIDAFDDRFDVLYLISSDADMTPPIRFIKERFGKEKEVVIVSPPEMRHSAAMHKYADRTIKLNESHLNQCLLPEIVFGSDGNIVRRPSAYEPT